MAEPRHVQPELSALGFGQKLDLYLRTVSTSWPRFAVEQLVFLLVSWIPTALGVALRAVLYRLIVPMGWPVLVERGVSLHRPAAIRLGSNVYLGENVYLLAGGEGITIGDATELLPNVALVIRDYRGFPNPRITIGARCSLNLGTVVFSHGSTTIGDDVQIGPGVVITTGNHLFDDPTRPVRTQGGAVAPVVIEDGAWIGARAVILPGVRIGAGAVVAAGAVVTTDVPARTLVAGVPARAVRDWDPGGGHAATS
jgi:acetyltransferase-like isoleucine patch superfamily enzyme